MANAGAKLGDGSPGFRFHVFWPKGPGAALDGACLIDRALGAVEEAAFGLRAVQVELTIVCFQAIPAGELSGG